MAKVLVDYGLRKVEVKVLDQLRLLVAISRQKGGKYKTMQQIVNAALVIGAAALNEEIRHGK